jgi:hypothetical protein
MNIFEVAFRKTYKNEVNLDKYTYYLPKDNKYILKSNKKVELILPTKLSEILEYAIYIRRFLDRYPGYSRRIMEGDLHPASIFYHKKVFNAEIIKKLASDLTIYKKIVYTYIRSQQKTTKGDATNDTENERNIWSRFRRIICFSCQNK